MAILTWRHGRLGRRLDSQRVQDRIVDCTVDWGDALLALQPRDPGFRLRAHQPVGCQGGRVAGRVDRRLDRLDGGRVPVLAPESRTKAERRRMGRRDISRIAVEGVEFVGDRIEEGAHDYLTVRVWRVDPR